MHRTASLQPFARHWQHNSSNDGGDLQGLAIDWYDFDASALKQSHVGKLRDVGQQLNRVVGKRQLLLLEFVGVQEYLCML